MSFQKMNYKKYQESLYLTGEPFDVSKLPKFKINFPAISKYANSVGKSVPELTEDEISPFIEGGYQRLVEYKLSLK